VPFLFSTVGNALLIQMYFACLDLASRALSSNGVPHRFLVFVNRILALAAATAIVWFSDQGKHRTPLHKYSFPSMSNVMSSWFQYEALKFVSFPTQVLAKASKVIPVMLMGKVVNGTTYPMWEYGCAAGLALGVAVFMFMKDEAGESAVADETATSVSGIILLVGYMCFDR
jgi:adenosine 3'-phospho 5'-phosphosulfate transporter B2